MARQETKCNRLHLSLECQGHVWNSDVWTSASSGIVHRTDPFYFLHYISFSCSHQPSVWDYALYNITRGWNETHRDTSFAYVGISVAEQRAYIRKQANPASRANTNSPATQRKKYILLRRQRNKHRWKYVLPDKKREAHWSSLTSLLLAKTKHRSCKDHATDTCFCATQKSHEHFSLLCFINRIALYRSFHSLLTMNCLTTRSHFYPSNYVKSTTKIHFLLRFKLINKQST